MKNRFGFSDALLMLLITPQLMDVQPKIVQFMHLSVQQGLSNQFISCILQNRKGFVWFDICLGSHFTTYQPAPADPILLYQPFFPTVDWYKSFPNGK